MTILIAANLSSAGATLSQDLSRWKGARAREVLWGCEYPNLGPDWFIYLPPYGFNWWLISEVETDGLAEEKIEKVNA
jgi:maltose alpha-D-glucosyltransferase/alpha-amylase